MGAAATISRAFDSDDFNIIDDNNPSARAEFRESSSKRARNGPRSQILEQSSILTRVA